MAIVCHRALAMTTETHERATVFSITPDHHRIAKEALSLVIRRVDEIREGRSDAEKIDDFAASTACMVLILCDFVTHHQPEANRKIARERIMNIVMSSIAHGDYADDSPMVTAVRDHIGKILQQGGVH